MGPPVADIEAVRQGTRRILLAVGDLTDEQAAARSRLPGWSRAEVLTHLARNADGGRGLAQSAARGEVGLIFANMGQAMMLGGRPIMSRATFSAVVVMVIVTTLVTPPALKWSLRRGSKSA